LLSDPVLTVGDVAVRCGFAHHSHFSDILHRVMGMTPTEYRRAM
jgi:transcriptional regulator GlxA family with amidase domain